MSKKISFFFSGGGSGGHTVPLLSIIEKLKKESFKEDILIYYFGQKEGIEKKILKKEVDFYLEIPAGKLRRYLSLKNFFDLFKISGSFLICFFKFFKFKNEKNIFFSSGGFVALPPLLAAFFHGIPIYLHEQTSRIGLTHFISKFFAKKIFLSFPETLKYYPPKKSLVTGYPLREIFYKKNLQLSLKDVKFPKNKKIILIAGGGNGSKLLNQEIRKNFSTLTKKYFVIHQVGQKEFSLFKNLKNKNYYPLAFLEKEDWVIFLKKADLIITRSGAGIVNECIFLNKKTLFIPLKIAQKNEQYYNALAAKRSLAKNTCRIILEDKLNSKILLADLEYLLAWKKSLPLSTLKKDPRKIILEHWQKILN